MVGKKHGVRHFVAEAIDDVGSPALTALLLLVAGRVKDLLEFDMGAIRSLSRIVKHGCLNLDIDIGRAWIGQKGFQRFGLGDARQRCGLQFIGEEIQRLSKVTMQSGVIAAVVKLRQRAK